jgi:hypothetical protein
LAPPTSAPSCIRLSNEAPGRSSEVIVLGRKNRGSVRNRQMIIRIEQVLREVIST